MQGLFEVGHKKFDVIILDPPTFSNSKKMTLTLDIQRDHEDLINDCLKYLAPGGVLYFSNNNLKFKLQYQSNLVTIKDITKWSLPEDFKNTNIHQCWKIQYRK